MTERDMDLLKLFWDEYKAEMERHQINVVAHTARIKHLVSEIAKVNKKCDHVYPSGKSAWVGCFTFSECKICGLTDL